MLCLNRSRLSRRLISPRVVRRMRLRGVGEKRSSLRFCVLCFGRGRRPYLLSTAGLRRRVGCLLCSRTGLRVCCTKPLARRSRIVATSNPRMQREYCTYTEHSACTSWRDCTACNALQTLPLGRPRPPRAARNPSRNKLVIHNITHYSPGTRSARRARRRLLRANRAVPLQPFLLPMDAVASPRRRGVYSASPRSPVQGLRPLVLAPRSRSRSSRRSCAALSSTKRSMSRA